MSKLTKSSTSYNLPVSVLPFIKSEPKEPVQKSYFFPHINYEVEPIKVEPEETPLTLRYEGTLLNSAKIERKRPLIPEPEYKASVSRALVIHDTLLKCKICDGTFFSNEEFNNHAKEHGMKYLCFNCSEVFQDRKRLRNHIQEFHFNPQNYGEIIHETFQNESGTTIMECKVCKETFEHGLSFRSHVKNKHNYKWTCWICYEVFPSGVSCKNHMSNNHVKQNHESSSSRRKYLRSKRLQQEATSGEPEEPISARLRSKKKK